MESTPRLYDTLVHILRQQHNWLDPRHVKTLAWITVGLIQSGKISVTARAPYVLRHAMEQRPARTRAPFLAHNH